MKKNSNRPAPHERLQRRDWPLLVPTYGLAKQSDAMGYLE